MFYNDFGDFLNNPPSFGSNSVFQKTSFLVFRTFRELRDSKKGKAKEHGSEFSRRTQWAENEDQKPNQLETRGPHAVRFPGRVRTPLFPLVAPMPSVFVSVASP